MITTSFEIVEAALEIVAPYRGALQPIGGTDVKHQEAIHIADEGLPIQIGREQLGMSRFHAAVAADV